MAPHTNWYYPSSYLLYELNGFHDVEKAVVDERKVCIYLNGHELASIMCSAYNLEELAIGFLCSERLIRNLGDIDVLTISESNNCVDVWSKDVSIKIPDHRTITSGCGSGVTFDGIRSSHEVSKTNLTIDPAQINSLMTKFLQVTDLYRDIGGVHTSALSKDQDIVLVAEDMGLANTVNRLWGRALQQGIDVRGCILQCSGRVVSDVLDKAVEMDLPVIISLTSPTSLSVEMAQKANITLIGYARGNSFRIYSAPQRIVGAV
jgi:FdhD protein